MEIRFFDRPLPRRRSRKEALLLAVLSVHAGHELDRRWLAATLWPESREAAALANLRNTLKDIRLALGAAADLIKAPRSRVLLLCPEDVECDVAAFDASIARGSSEALEAVVALYRGPLLDGYTETWVLRSASRGPYRALAAKSTAVG